MFAQRQRRRESLDDVSKSHLEHDKRIPQSQRRCVCDRCRRTKTTNKQNEIIASKAESCVRWSLPTAPSERQSSTSMRAVTTQRIDAQTDDIAKRNIKSKTKLACPLSAHNCSQFPHFRTWRDRNRSSLWCCRCAASPPANRLYSDTTVRTTSTTGRHLVDIQSKTSTTVQINH